MQFSDGDELSAIRAMCQAAMRNTEMFSDFHAKLNYVTQDEEVMLPESETVDVGGVTCRLLTGAWKSLFNGSAVSFFCSLN